LRKIWGNRGRELEEGAVAAAGVFWFFFLVSSNWFALYSGSWIWSFLPVNGESSLICAFFYVAKHILSFELKSFCS
jgi:hypothetical protein